ncbi:hypothetical protein C4587_00425 [Candidatus Parcubacteria bacterium]|nr:MAG: hypothetical protein C4587_00425 [Candidatus Parcubacteria bacterium]
MDPETTRSFFELGFWSSKPFGVIKGIFLILDALLAFGFVLAVVKGLKFRPHFEIRGSSTRARAASQRNKFFRDRWDATMKKFMQGTPDAVRVAIIEADSLVDEALKQMSFPGEHFADRLQKLNKEDFKTLDRLWAAHRIRNDLVHTPGFFLSASDAKGVLEDYQAFLKEFGVL